MSLDLWVAAQVALSQQIQVMNKSGRNDPCPCGSGKKFKKCCLPREESAYQRRSEPEPEKEFTTELRPDVDDKVDRVLERLERGQHENVEADLTALLKAYPDYHITNFAMGVYRAKIEEDPVGAIPFFEKAIEIFPYFSEAHYNLGNCACKAAQIRKAVLSYRAALRYSAGDDTVASLARKELKHLEQIVTHDSPFKNLDAYLENQLLFDQAFQELTNKNSKRAVEGFQKVLEQNPNHVQSHGNLGLAYAQLGQKALALECLNKALALDPGYEPAQFNRLNVERMQEGEPLAARCMETEYYAEKMAEEKGTPGSPPAPRSWWERMARLRSG
jgi:tetratricopeptide (TPR) repeat protein